MSVASEITRIKNNIANAYTNAESKGATMPSVENSENLASTIASIPSGSGENKVAQLIDGSITTITAEDFGDATKIRPYAFYYSSSLISITIPAGVTEIWYHAFNSCTNLTTVTFAEGSQLTMLGVQAFTSCEKLLSIEIPAGVTKIENYAFNRCFSFTSITIPAGVTEIGEGAFWNCKNLTTVTFAEGSQLTSMRKASFQQCVLLTSITIPAGVTSMKQSVFYGCNNLTTMRIEATTPPQLDATDAISSATTQIQVPMASVDAYKTATNWSAFADIIVGYTE